MAKPKIPFDPTPEDVGRLKRLHPDLQDKIDESSENVLRNMGRFTKTILWVLVAPLIMFFVIGMFGVTGTTQLAIFVAVISATIFTWLFYMVASLQGCINICIDISEFVALNLNTERSNSEQGK